MVRREATMSYGLVTFSQLQFTLPIYGSLRVSQSDHEVPRLRIEIIRAIINPVLAVSMTAKLKIGQITPRFCIPRGQKAYFRPRECRLLFAHSGTLLSTKIVDSEMNGMGLGLDRTHS